MAPAVHMSGGHLPCAVHTLEVPLVYTLVVPIVNPGIVVHAALQACARCYKGSDLRCEVAPLSMQINEAQEAIQEGTEGAKDAVKGAVDKAGDAIKKVTGQD